MSISRLVLAALPVLVLASGCRSKPGEPAKVEAGADDGVAEPAVEYVVSEAPAYAETLELDEPGVEPRAAVRYAGPVPARKLSLATFPKVFDRDYDETPLVDLRIEWAADVSRGERATVWDVVELGGELGGEHRAGKMAGGLAQMFERVEGRAEGDARGQLRILQTQGASTQPDIPRQLELFVVPLPEAPVGVGARWSAIARYKAPVVRVQARDPGDGFALGGLVSDQKVERGEVEVIQTERYTLVAREGDRLTLDYALELDGGGAEGFYPSSATGTLVVDLHDSLAYEGSIEHRTQLSMPAVEGVEQTAKFSVQRFVLRTLE